MTLVILLFLEIIGQRFLSPQKGNDSRRVSGAVRSTACRQRAGPDESTIFCGSKFTLNLEPSILQLNSTFFSSLATVSSPPGVFLAKKNTAAVTKPLSSRS